MPNFSTLKHPPMPRPVCTWRAYELMVMVLFLLACSDWQILKLNLTLKSQICKSEDVNLSGKSQTLARISQPIISNCHYPNLKYNLKTQRRQIRSKVFRLAIGDISTLNFTKPLLFTRIQRQRDSNLLVTDYYKQVFIVQHHT